MLKRRYRVVLDYEVDVEELTLDWVKARYHDQVRRSIDMGFLDVLEDLSEPSAEQTEDQRILQKALLASGETLETWLRDEVASELEACGLDGITRTESPEVTLRQIIESLPPRQRHRFRESVARDSLYEDAEDFIESFRVELTDVRIEAVG